MMKKRLITMVLAGALAAAALSGCAATSSDGGQTADDAYNIALIVKLTDGHFNKVMAGAQAYADAHDNVNVEIQSSPSATSYEEQLNMIETALSNPSIDALIISPLQSDSASTIVANADKPIIALDTDFTSDKKSAFVGTGNEDAAAQGGAAAIEAAKARGVENPAAVILTGVQGDETHEARLKGYTDGATVAGGSIVEVQYCDAQADRAALAMEGIMQKYPDGIDVVLSTNDDMALAAAKIIRDAKNDVYSDTVVCGFDGNQAAISALQTGELTVDVAQLGYDMGYKAMEAMTALLDGQDVESFIDSGSQVVTADNVDDYIADMTAKGLWE